MRAYYISSGLQGCYLVRCLLPLSANGWDGDQTSIRLDTKSIGDKSKAANASDIVVFHRPEDEKKLELAKLLQKSGKKIVFDNDDTYKDDGGFKFNEFMNKERMEKGLTILNENIDKFIEEADLVTCSTEFLKQEYLKLNPNVVVLPNCIDPFYFDEPLRNEGDKIRIGLVGSLGLTADLNVIEKIMNHYKGDDRIQWVLFSLPPAKNDKITRELYSEEYKFWENMDIEWQPLVPMEEYYETLNNLKLDIMIIPREDNYFNRCKSNIKFLEASMFEIPVIAQSFNTKDSPYEVNPEDAKHMLLANTTEEWIEHIETLINDKKLRLNMGKKAKKYVEHNYSIENKAHLWKEAYQSLL